MRVFFVICPKSAIKRLHLTFHDQNQACFGLLLPVLNILLRSLLYFNIVRVTNDPTGQVLEAGRDWLVLVDANDWTRRTWEVRSGLDWSQTSLHKRSHESLNGTQANPR